MVTYRPATPVHFPAQLAKRCGAVAGSASGSTGVAVSTGGAVLTGASVVVVMSPGAGASAFSQPASRSEEHTSELQSLMRNSYAVFCLKKKHTLTKTKSIRTVYAQRTSTR